ncbi:KAT8 regulatory NSL complex subunit 3 [Leptopilina heterotoma]|uniref:KAT8 regulatory NSL complex subunit 3 n=1 Tax=Leptopilina heterotoma TaxID=63436 RepID=UPI001CA7E7C4|nr:KAT8 regulatory NSL complex subunit 3 [Leptopilina heterotoma]
MAEVVKQNSGKDNFMKMLLTSGATVTPQGNPGLPSPTGEIIDDNPNRFTTYLHQLAGCYELEVDVIVRDHCYARPWNWKPENVYVKPIKKIFFTKNHILSDKQKSEEKVDVEYYNNNQSSSPPFDLGRTRHLMDELQRLANFVRPDEDTEWEEKIDKTFWSQIQIRVFAKIVRVLTAERLARLAKTGNVMEPVFRRTSIDTAAKRFREIMASIGWDIRISQWIHCLLFDYLPQEYLVIYLDILQTLRLIIPQLIDKMIAVQTNINGKGGPVTWETLGSLLKRSWDPVTSTLNSNKPKKLPGNPILVIAPSTMGNNSSSRQLKWVSQLGALGMVVSVFVPSGLSATKMTMMTCMDQLVQATRTKLQEVRSDCPGRPIILMGFNTGAALACQIAQMEHVTAVICLGFPFNTVEGKRGSPDDTLMDIRCPVMFVVGQNATLVRPDDLEDLREKMLVETSLVVVGTADDHLRISTAKKISEGVTQSMVDRCILDEIGDFVGSILLQPHPLPLRPATLANLDGRNKKDCRKRRNSTSSSVESEPNSPNVKKSRPGTPVLSTVPGGQIIASASVSRVGNLPNLTTNLTNLPVSGTTVNLPPAVKRKPRVVSNQRANFPESLISSRLMSQQSINSGNGGITLNIGSLASLSPAGPMKFTSGNIVSQNSPGITKAGVMTKTPTALQKSPKLMQPGTPNIGKMKTVSMAGGSHLKSNSSSITVPQVKPSSTSGALSALLQSGKNTISIGGRPITSSVLLTPSVTVTPTSSPVAPSKVMDSYGPVNPNDYLQKNSKSSSSSKEISSRQTSQSNKIYPPNTNNLVLLENSCKTKISSSGQNSVTILPFTTKMKNSEKTVKIIPKITANNLSRNPRPKQETTNTTNSNFLNDDLGNILDIPIIFAKDGETINSIEKSPILPQNQIPNTLENPPQPAQLPLRNPKLGPTKVVLISNKQDKSQPGKLITSQKHSFLRQSLPKQNLNHVLLQPKNQNPVISNRSSPPLQNSSRSNESTVKYTKIILAKRNSLSNIAHKDKGEQPVILTKTNQKLSTQRIYNNDNNKNEHASASKIINNFDDEFLEIEEAIKPNIIERKIINTTEVVDSLFQDPSIQNEEISINSELFLN